MQIILLEKIANVGNLGDVVKVKDGFARNLPDPARQGEARHAGEPQGCSRRSAPSSKRRAADKLAAAQALAAKLEGATIAGHAEGRRRRPPVRLGHQRRHRRSAARRRASDVEKCDGEDAVRTAEAGRRSSASAVSLHTDVTAHITVHVVGETVRQLSACPCADSAHAMNRRAAQPALSFSSRFARAAPR